MYIYVCMYMCGEIGKNKLLYSASFPLVFGVLGATLKMGI